MAHKTYYNHSVIVHVIAKMRYQPIDCLWFVVAQKNTTKILKYPTTNITQFSQKLVVPGGEMLGWDLNNYRLQQHEKLRDRSIKKTQ